MKHLESPQSPSPRPTAAPIATSRISGWKLIAAGLALVMGIGYGLTHLLASTAKDAISNAEQSRLITAFATLGSLQPEPVANDHIDNALVSMGLTPNQRQTLKDRLTALVTTSASKGNAAPLKDDTVLVWIILWDFAAADGDVVRVSTAGYTLDVQLQKAQTRIAVPVDVARSIRIAGIRDGGGGITLGIQNGASAISLPVLTVGQTLSLPLSL